MARFSKPVGKRYHPENKHSETCVFETYNRDTGKMEYCGELAYGVIGKHPVCEEHFRYSCSVHNESPDKAPMEAKKHG